MFPSFLLNNRSGVFISTDNLLRVWFPSLYTSSETVHWISVQFSSVRSLDRLNRREDLRASATEILSQSVLHCTVSSSMLGYLLHTLHEKIHYMRKRKKKDGKKKKEGRKKKRVARKTNQRLRCCLRKPWKGNMRLYVHRNH